MDSHTFGTIMILALSRNALLARWENLAGHVWLSQKMTRLYVDTLMGSFALILYRISSFHLWDGKSLMHIRELSHRCLWIKIMCSVEDKMESCVCGVVSIDSWSHKYQCIPRMLSVCSQISKKQISFTLLRLINQSTPSIWKQIRKSFSIKPRMAWSSVCLSAKTASKS